LKKIEDLKMKTLKFFNKKPITMRVAVVGATGLVGTKMLQVLAERNFPVTELIPVASARSVGKEVMFKGKAYKIVGMEEGIAAQPAVAIFSAGGSTSTEWAPKFAAAGIRVIDNSSAWRMDPTKKLVVPEVNASVLTSEDMIIANPNCSTIQMVVALQPLHAKYKIKRVIVSTYQSVTGTGKQAVDQLMEERAGKTLTADEMAYKYQIDLNAINIKVTATTVRIPVMGGHSESVNVEFENEFDLNELIAELAAAPGVVVQQDDATQFYPMPLWAHEKDEVFVGRLRRDETQAKTLNMWIVSDNLRKGAATNAVQIAEYLAENGII
jgi:aspartate-semialdehyde dehydrogenase